MWVWLAGVLAEKLYDPDNHSPVTLDILTERVGPELDKVRELSTGVEREFDVRPLLSYLGVHNLVVGGGKYRKRVKRRG